MVDWPVLTRRHLDSAHNGMCVVDADGTISYANTALAAIVGCADPEALVGRRWRDIYPSGRTVLHGGGGVGEALLSRSDGANVGVTLGTTPIDSSSPEVAQILVTVWPLSNSKESPAEKVTNTSEARLEKTLAARDHLLRELNHRVANNLAMLSALIDLKTFDTDDGEALREIQQHISAIRQLHQKLAGSGAKAQIDLGEYLPDIVRTFFQTFGEGAVSLEEDTESVPVSSKVAVLVGLVVNEIATNAVKHGFVPHGENSFILELHREDAGSMCRLVMGNRGRPFPNHIDPATAETTGLQLVRALVEQLDGTLELRKHPYPLFTIRFRARTDTSGA